MGQRYGQKSENKPQAFPLSIFLRSLRLYKYIHIQIHLHIHIKIQIQVQTQIKVQNSLERKASGIPALHFPHIFATGRGNPHIVATEKRRFNLKYTLLLICGLP